jgi:hypothetical protein
MIRARRALEPPQGLVVREDFLTTEDERELLDRIEQARVR